MAFESGESAPKSSPSERPPESHRSTTDVRTMLPKNGEVLNGVRQMRTKISGIFAAVNPSQNSDK